jgi:hypothetical protein
MNQELEKLKQEEQELEEKLSANQNRQKEIFKAEFVKKYGVDVGDEVEWEFGRKSMRGVIAAISCDYHQPYYHANLFIGKGTLGKRAPRIWNPETIQLIKKAEPAKQ